MPSIESILSIPPYSLKKEEKSEMLSLYLSDLTKRHYERCESYRRILDAFSFSIKDRHDYYDIPFLPVRLFKDYELLSVHRDDIVKTMTSSGTTGQSVSKIFLDKETAAVQQKALSKIITSYIGPKRLPMLILDSSAILKDRNMFSARGAGILGFSIFGSDKMYALDENMNLDIPGVSVFLDKHKGEDILLFGFTFMVWQHFYKELIKTGYKPDLSRGILFHGGGWKKLLGEAVSSLEFKKRLNDASGINRVHDYYGMVEQTGAVYVECELGHLHSSIFSDIITRRHYDFSVCSFGEIGIIEVVSILPESYPGHILLTEDEGVIIGEDDCACGRLGKYFKITGRIKNAELRGCSDTYAVKF